jgi:hypothetical protein
MRSAAESFLIPRSFLTVRRHNTDLLSIQVFKRGSRSGLSRRGAHRIGLSEPIYYFADFECVLVGFLSHDAVPIRSLMVRGRG